MNLAGVGACTAMTAAFYAALNDIPIKSYRIDMKGYANFGGFYGVSDTFRSGSIGSSLTCPSRRTLPKNR